MYLKIRQSAHFGILPCASRHPRSLAIDRIVSRHMLFVSIRFYTSLGSSMNLLRPQGMRTEALGGLQWLVQGGVTSPTVRIPAGTCIVSCYSLLYCIVHSTLTRRFHTQGSFHNVSLLVFSLLSSRVPSDILKSQSPIPLHKMFFQIQRIFLAKLLIKSHISGYMVNNNGFRNI
jgi:hypothetical protein